MYTVRIHNNCLGKPDACANALNKIRLMKIKYIVYVILTVLILLFSWKEYSAIKNEKDIKSVKIGMHYNEARLIMKGDVIDTYFQHTYDSIPVFTDYYSSTFGASDHLQIWYSKQDSTVVHINYGE